VEVAVHPLRGRRPVGAGQVHDRPEGGAQTFRVLLQAGYDGQRRLEPAEHRLGQRGQVAGVPRLGGELVGEHVVDLGGRQAQPFGLTGEVPAHLVGVQVGLGEQVPNAGEREVPAVAGGAQELLQHRQLERLLSWLALLAADRCELEPAVEGGHVLAAVLGQRPMDHDVRVEARRHLAEHLHQAVLAERDGGVALLTREQRRVDVGVQVVVRQPVERQVADDGFVGERPQPQLGGVAVVQRVVGDDRAVLLVLPRSDDLRVVGQRHLVGLHDAARVAQRHHLDAHPGQAVRTVAAEHPRPSYLDPVDVTTLAAEPAGRLDVLLHRRCRLRTHRAHAGVHAAPPSGSGCGAGNRNQ
jgi:hypothetical protein